MKLNLQLLVLALSLLSFTVYADDDEEEGEKKKTSAYISLGAPMILNLTNRNGRLTFLQLEANVLIFDDDMEEEIEVHIPAIRHELILALSEQPVKDMKSPTKREELRKIVTANVKTRISKIMESDEINEVLFSNFLVQ